MSSVDICKLSNFDLFLMVGGYWSKDDTYLGGESHSMGTHTTYGFLLKTIEVLLVEDIGYEENMRKVAWFPPETPLKKEDIDDDEGLQKALSYAGGSGALTLYIVREDDPYLIRRGGADLGVFSDDEIENNGSSDDSDSSSDDEDGSDVAGTENADNDGFVPVLDRERDGFSGDTEITRERQDESKYKKFEIGQEFSTVQSFKSAVLKYAVKKKYDISFFKSDSKRFIVACSDRKCPWRICASINITSTRVMVRTLQEEHDCTWQGKVSLLTNARIAELFIEEFRVNPNFSANQLQAKLLNKNVNVFWTICERTKLRCL